LVNIIVNTIEKKRRVDTRRKLEAEELAGLRENVVDFGREKNSADQIKEIDGALYGDGLGDQEMLGSTGSTKGNLGEDEIRQSGILGGGLVVAENHDIIHDLLGLVVVAADDLLCVEIGVGAEGSKAPCRERETKGRAVTGKHI
jgi:hypothetical protein